MLQIINPLTILFTVVTAFGVLIHDTQVDRATMAYALPALAVGYAVADISIKQGDSHVHVERAHAPRVFHAGLRSSLPRLQPREDDRRHIQTKKLFYSGGNAEFIWPSV